jgi:hypothetical protein
VKIIRNKNTKIVSCYYSDNDEIILTEKALSGLITNPNVNSIEYEIIENTKPLEFNPEYGKLIYDDGFTVVDQELYNTTQQTKTLAAQKEQIKNNITEIENTITPRRIRESTLGTDNGWLTNVETQITELRNLL